MYFLANTAIPSREISLLFLATGLLLAAARCLGEIAKRFNLPSVLGELLAGVLLGPTIFGWGFPHAEAAIFPPTGDVAVAVVDGIAAVVTAAGPSLFTKPL